MHTFQSFNITTGQRHINLNYRNSNKLNVLIYCILHSTLLMMYIHLVKYEWFIVVNIDQNDLFIFLSIHFTSHFYQDWLVMYLFILI